MTRLRLLLGLAGAALAAVVLGAFVFFGGGSASDSGTPAQKPRASFEKVRLPIHVKPGRGTRLIPQRKKAHRGG